MFELHCLWYLHAPLQAGLQACDELLENTCRVKAFALCNKSHYCTVPRTTIQDCLIYHASNSSMPQYKYYHKHETHLATAMLIVGAHVTNAEFTHASDYNLQNTDSSLPLPCTSGTQCRKPQHCIATLTCAICTYLCDIAQVSVWPGQSKNTCFPLLHMHSSNPYEGVVNCWEYNCTLLRFQWQKPPVERTVGHLLID